jgi:glycosidase
MAPGMLNMERTFFALVLLLAGWASAGASGNDASPICLANRWLELSFDRQTGAWIGLHDAPAGDDLIASPASKAMLLPPPIRKLNWPVLQQAMATGKAIELSDHWLYTPTPPPATEAAGYLQGRFEAGKWQPTAVPSRRATGDDRLHNRVGEFYYRREFLCPAHWPDEEMVFVLGAADDFDETYLNGTMIGATGLETPHHWETARVYRFPARLLHRGQANTLLIKVTNAAFDGGLDGPAVLGLATAVGAAEQGGPPLAKFTVSRDGEDSVLSMVVRTDPYEYRLEYALAAEQPTFSRQLTIRNVGAREIVLRNFALATPPLRVGPNQAAIFPGSLPVGDNCLARLQGNQDLRSRSQEPLAVLWDGEKQRGLGTWYHCEEEFSPVIVRRAGTAAEIRHVQHIVARLKSGEAVTLGRQFFWIAHGSRDAGLAAVQPVYRSIHLRAPDHALSHLAGQILYCGHPGGTPEQHFRGYGGFAALQRYVPTLKKMGIDLVWLLPIWEHGDGRKWNLYAPFDHFRVSPLYGTADELRQLSAAYRQSGIGLLFDLVPHGPPDFTPLAKEHPEWISLDPQGKPIYAWSEYAFDNAHPGWQDYMRRAAEWDARQFGAVGARVDCGAGGPLNWNPALGNRPSLSSLAGGLGMNRAIREGFLKANSQVLLLPEEYSGANIFYRVADLTYDAQFYFLMADLQSRTATPAQWAAALQTFLHDQQLTLPPGALKMRWISNHDTVSWTFQKQRPQRCYGLERMRALLAVCALIEGVPMLYQGDEDPAIYGGEGPSSVEFLARLYALRKELPAIGEGTADYQSVQASEGVFACLRRSAQQEALVLVSLNPQAVESTIRVPERLVADWRDRLSAETVRATPSFRMAMAPGQVRVLVRGR